MTTTKHEAKTELCVFRYSAQSMRKYPENITGHGTSEYEQGIEAFLAERGYHLCPGLSPLLQTYRSDGAAVDRYVVVGHLERYTFLVFAQNKFDYEVFMQKHGQSFPAWDELFIEEQQSTPNNYVVGGPLVARPTRW